MRKLKSVIVICALALLVALPALGQVVSGSLSGVAKDSQGAVITGAKVTIESLATGRSFTSTTDNVGRFRFPYLAVGDYKLSVEKEYYQPYIVERLKINLGSKDFFTIELQTVTEFEGQVVVTASRPLIETTKSTIDIVIDSSIVDNLPVMERDFFDLLLMMNNVQELNNEMTSVGGSEGISISGGRVEDNIFQVDGADSNSSFDGQRQQFYSLDVIQEVQLSTAGFTAEYGRGAGGVVNVVTKSGSDRYSGRFSYYLRDDAMDQNSEDLEWRYQDMSFSFGGPIIKKELYFFANYNRIQRHDSRDYIIDYWVANPQRLENKFVRNAIFTKFNYFPSTNHEFDIGFNWEPSKLEQPLTNGLRPERDGYTEKTGGTSITAHHTWHLNDSSLTDTFINVKNISKSRVRNTPSDPPVGKIWYLPSESGSGSIATYEGPQFFASENDEFGFNIAEKYQYLSSETGMGVHTLTIGGDLGYTSLDATEELYNVYYNQRGVLPPVEAPYYRIEVFGDPNFAFSQTEAAAYVQDDWQLAKNLTFNLGARVDYNDFLKNTVFSPRLGFAYDPIGDQSTVIRGGAGVYYSKSFFAMQRRANEPLRRTYLDYSGKFDNPRPITSIYTVADDVKTPYSLEGSLGVERMLTSEITIGVNYMFKKFYDQFYLRVENLPGVSTGQRENPNIDMAIWKYGNQGWSEYNGLSFNFNKRFSNRWMFRAGYTWSQSKGNSSRYAPTSLTSLLWSTQENQDSWITGEGPTDFDLPHQLKLTTIIQLPFDVMVSGFYLIRSGYPFSVQESFQSIPTPINTERLPNWKQLDMRLQKTFSFGQNLKLHVYFDMINALNDQNVVYVNRFAKNYGGDPNPNYLKGYYYARERESQIGIKFDF